MQSGKQVTFTVNGHEITAVFAAEKNPSIYDYVKQVLISSFINNDSLCENGNRTFALNGNSEDNTGRSDSCAP